MLRLCFMSLIQNIGVNHVVHWQLPTSHSLLSTCVSQGSVCLSVAIGQTVWTILCANCLADVQPAGDLL